MRLTKLQKQAIEIQEAEEKARILLEDIRKKKANEASLRHYHNKKDEINLRRRQKKQALKEQNNPQIIKVNRIGQEITPVENIPVEEIKLIIENKPVQEETTPIEEIKTFENIPVEEIKPDLIEIIQVETIKPIEEIKPEIIEIKPEIIEIKKEEEITPVLEEIKPIENISVEIIPVVEDKKHDTIDEILTDNVINDVIKDVFISNLDLEISLKRQQKHHQEQENDIMNKPFGYPENIEPINKITSKHIFIQPQRKKTQNNKINNNVKNIVIHTKSKTLKKVNFSF